MLFCAIYRLIIVNCNFFYKMAANLLIGEAASGFIAGMSGCNQR